MSESMINFATIFVGNVEIRREVGQSSALTHYRAFCNECKNYIETNWIYQSVLVEIDAQQHNRVMHPQD